MINPVFADAFEANMDMLLADDTLEPEGQEVNNDILGNYETLQKGIRGSGVENQGAE
jgi:hypothetical protein